MSPYNLAVSAWISKPEILAIDLDGWRGAHGEVVRVQARDDFLVKQVIVRFNGAAGELLEEGAAEDTDGPWWEYTARQDLTGLVTVTAIANDLPGNRSEMSREKTASPAISL